MPIIRRKLLYLSDTGICHSDWLTSGLLVGLKLRFNPTSKPDVNQSERQMPVLLRYSNFLLMMGTWMSETRREAK